MVGAHFALFNEKIQYFLLIQNSFIYLVQKYKKEYQNVDMPREIQIRDTRKCDRLRSEKMRRSCIIDERNWPSGKGDDILFDASQLSLYSKRVWFYDKRETCIPIVCL
jgi:hypothetical protein